MRKHDPWQQTKRQKLLWSSLNERPNGVNVHGRIKLNQYVHLDCISVAMNNILWMKYSRICVT